MVHRDGVSGQPDAQATHRAKADRDQEDGHFESVALIVVGWFERLGVIQEELRTNRRRNQELLRWQLQIVESAQIRCRPQIRKPQRALLAAEVPLNETK